MPRQRKQKLSLVLPRWTAFLEIKCSQIPLCGKAWSRLIATHQTALKFSPLSEINETKRPPPRHTGRPAPAEREGGPLRCTADLRSRLHTVLVSRCLRGTSLFCLRANFPGTSGSASSSLFHHKVRAIIVPISEDCCKD